MFHCVVKKCEQSCELVRCGTAPALEHAHELLAEGQRVSSVEVVHTSTVVHRVGGNGVENWIRNRKINGLQREESVALTAMSEHEFHAQYLAAPVRRRDEVLAKPYPVPAQPGVYGWWFKTIPADMDTSKCVRRDDGLVLLYAGISPSKPSAAGVASKQNIRRRIKLHYAGNASVSTLRKSLGCLLSQELGIELRRVGPSERCTFGVGEASLSEWMARNALVSWITHPRPWMLEDELIETLVLPLNIDGAHNAFTPVLRQARRSAMARAKELPPLP